MIRAGRSGRLARRKLPRACAAAVGTVSSDDRGTFVAVPDTIGLWRRWLLYRQGRMDGRYRNPDPIMIEGSVTTRTRVELGEEYVETVAKIQEFCGCEIERCEDELRVIDARISSLRGVLDETAQELAAVEARKPDLTNVRRRVGERDLPIELVRDRRQREHEDEVRQGRARLAGLQETLHNQQQRQACLRAKVEGLRRWPTDARYRLEALLVRKRAIYDRALLRRHPQSSLVRPLLDDTVPPVPPWQYHPDAPVDRLER